MLNSLLLVNAYRISTDDSFTNEVKVFVQATMSRDKVHCSSVILSVVAKGSVKVFDDVDMFAAVYHFGVFDPIR